MYYHCLPKDGTYAVNYSKHTLIWKERGAFVPFYWFSVIWPLLLTRLHTVPMVPNALIGYCKVWDRAPAWSSITPPFARLSRQLTGL